MPAGQIEGGILSIRKVCRGPIDLSADKGERAAMRRREHVEPIRCDKRSGVCARSGHRLLAGAGTGVDGLDQPWLANGNMDNASCRIDECDVGSSGKRPRVAGLT